MRTLAFFLLTWIIALTSNACKSSCDGEDRTVVVTTGQVRLLRIDGTEEVRPVEDALAEPAPSEGVLLRTYESAPWFGPLAPFEGGNTLQFVHGLGVVPDSVSSYVSFWSDGVDSENVAENAGDSSLILCVDERVVLLKNNTCENKFQVRLVAQATQTGSAAPSKPCVTEP